MIYCCTKFHKEYYLKLVTKINFIPVYIYIYIYRVSQEECTKLRESIP